MFIQCQRCSISSKLTSPLDGRRLPWQCPRCHARHRVTISDLLKTLQGIELEDRYVLPMDLSCPADVLRDFQEAAFAFNADAPRASVVMVRRALENACDAMNANGGRLADKIKDLAMRKIFDEHDAAAATTMRIFGNYGAHPKDDLLDEADDQRAELALKIAERFLKKFPHPGKP